MAPTQNDEYRADYGCTMETARPSPHHAAVERVVEQAAAENPGTGAASAAIALQCFDPGLRFALRETARLLTECRQARERGDKTAIVSASMAWDVIETQHHYLVALPGETEL